MTLETVSGIILYRWPGGQVRLEPGMPVSLPDDRARRLLTKLGPKVRIVPPVGNRVELTPGSIVTWHSPALGTLSGELLAVHANGWMDVFHPLTEAVACIPMAWLVGTETPNAT